MFRSERLALELLELRLDLLEGRPVSRAGTSTDDLYSYLLKEMALLKPPERRRLDQLTERLSLLASRAPEVTLEDLQLDLEASFERAQQEAEDEDAALTPGEKLEKTSLKALAARVWQDELAKELERLALLFRAEKQRYGSRLVYASLRNLARYAEQPGFTEDINLLRFEVMEAVPELSDGLASVTAPGVALALLNELVDTILNFRAPDSPYRQLALPEEQTLTYFKRLASAVARDPYAGRFTILPPRTTSSQLRVAIEELDKEQLPPAQHRQQQEALEARLDEVLAGERAQRKLFNEDVANYSRVAQVLFSALAALLPRRVGGLALAPQLPGGVLAAENPALRLTAVPEGARAVTLALRGATRFRLLGLEVLIQGSGDNFKLVLPEFGLEEALENCLCFTTPDHRLRAYREGGYAHLMVEEAKRSLATLLAEARVVQFLLNAKSDCLGLELVAAATATPMGGPLATARRALAGLQVLYRQARGAKAALKDALIRAAGELNEHVPDDFTDYLVTLLQRAFTADALGLATILEGLPDSDSRRCKLGSEPLSVQVAGQPLSLRAYDGVTDTLVLMQLGRPLGAFDDYLLTPFSGGTLIVAKADDEVAFVYSPKAAIRVKVEGA